MDINANITKRIRKRKLTSGAIVLQERWVLNYKDPRSGLRRQEFFEKKRDAEARSRELAAQVADNTFIPPKEVPTVAAAVKHYLADREGKVKPSTLMGYEVVCKCITGPLLEGTPQERADFTATGKKPKKPSFIAMLGDEKLNELTTAKIRGWHRIVVEQVGTYTANRAKAHLKSTLALAEEDFGIRAPSMPTGLSRARHKPKKTILASADIARLIKAAKADEEQGPYYAFPFLAGTRPSEQLGLLWDDIDFAAGVIRTRFRRLAKGNYPGL